MMGVCLTGKSSWFQALIFFKKKETRKMGKKINYPSIDSH